MSKFSKLSAFYLFLLLMGATPSGLHLFTAHQSVALAKPAPYQVARLTPEQETLAKHLADKYSQPRVLLTRIVLAAYAEGARFGLSPLTLLAIMEKESGFRTQIVNAYGAVGLMQVVPRYHLDKLAKADPVTELKHPETNIHVGAKILSEYLGAKKGNLKLALIKYSGNARAYGERVAFFQSKLTALKPAIQCAPRTLPCTG